MSVRREPAVLWIGVIAPVVAVIAAFLFPTDAVSQGFLNAAAVAVAGAVTAALVQSDRLLPALTGAFQAVVAAVAAFGLGWSPEQQSLLVLALGAIAAVVVRDRVTAPEPPVAA